MKVKINRKKIIIFVIVLILILLIISSYFIFLKSKNRDENNIIIATKIEENNGQNIEVRYKIGIDNYDLSIIEKTLIFETEEEAKTQYKIYDIINENQRKGMVLKQDKKKVTIIVPIELFKEEINYQDENTIEYKDENGEIRKIISQNELTEKLITQDYEIK